MSEPKPMDPERLADIRRRLAGERVAWIEDVDHRDVLAELLADRDYWQARVDVSAEDLNRVGVTLARLSTWLTANGWAVQPFDGSSWDGWKKGDEWLDVARSLFDTPQIAASVRQIADAEKRSQWDILTEVASTDPAGESHG